MADAGVNVLSLMVLFNLVVCSSDRDSDSVSSTVDFIQERAAPTRQKNQNQSLLDKLTQEKLNSKTKPGNKRNDLSSGMDRNIPTGYYAPALICLSNLSSFLFSFAHLSHVYFKSGSNYFVTFNLSYSQPMLGGHPSSLTELHAQKHQVKSQCKSKHCSLLCHLNITCMQI